MQKRIFGLCFLLVFGSCSLPLDESKVPQTVKDSFAARYNSDHIRWMRAGGTKFKVHFQKNNRQVSAVFDDKGHFIEQESEINSADLPAAITDYVKNNLQNKKITEAALIIQASGNIIYEAEVKGKDYFFTKEGKLISFKEAE